MRKMEKVKTVIVGGGASGLFCALCHFGNDLVVLEKGDRVGKKLSATGNGQGNVSNVKLTENEYFCKEKERLAKLLRLYPSTYTLGLMEQRGGLFVADERGRIYPAGKQASAVTDLLRFSLAAEGKRTITDCTVTAIEKKGDGFVVSAQAAGKMQAYFAENVVFAAGGKAAKNFGTDGSSFEMLKKLGHSVSKLYPSLVQLKTDTSHIKGLKGIRVRATVTALLRGKELCRETGDVIFTDYGVSGDAIFRVSAFITDKNERVVLSLNFAPDVSDERIKRALMAKKAHRAMDGSGILSGILPSALGRAIIKRAETDDVEKLLELIRDFTLDVTGTLGFDYAQVTKGGVPLCEVTDSLESKIVNGLYIIGEALDVDGQCGGYNLQWAFTSAAAACDSINNK